MSTDTARARTLAEPFAPAEALWAVPKPVLRTPRVRARVRATQRAIVLADLGSLLLCFFLATVLASQGRLEYPVFVASLPIWVAGARLLGLYERDQRRIGHTTIDELGALFCLVTVGTFLLGRLALFAPGFHPTKVKLTVFWAFAVFALPAARSVARRLVRRHRMRTIVVGSGIVGQLVARKLDRHREYGLDLIGFVADGTDTIAPDLQHLPLLGTPEELAAAAKRHDIDRVILAFPPRQVEDMIELVRPLRDLGVQVDIVPRLFDTLGPAASMHSLEGLPLIALPAARLAPASLLIKRLIDVVGASFLLVLAAPLLLWIAWRIKRDSPGPVLFRQTRLGMDMREFTLLKFRTMTTDASPREHRAFMRTIANRHSAPPENGLFKFETYVTKVGSRLRKTSLDELPQLWNVLRGEMSLVGPRPCIPYETENFASHHFDRFRVPQGLTGFWQVTARNRSTFAEALDMDVAYARSWSLGLDARIMLLTPLVLLRKAATA
jgi:exopolysaccharide biosynthesis polyprenyl glycosylphosphotransferase